MGDYCDNCEWMVECVDYVPYGDTSVPMTTYWCEIPRGEVCPHEEEEEEDEYEV